MQAVGVVCFLPSFWVDPMGGRPADCRIPAVGGDVGSGQGQGENGRGVASCIEKIYSSILSSLQILFRVRRERNCYY